MPDVDASPITTLNNHDSLNGSHDPNFIRRRSGSNATKSTNPSRTNSIVEAPRDFNPRRDTLLSVGSSKNKKSSKSKRSRSKSTASAVSAHSGSIAAALARSGLAVAGATADIDLATNSSRPSSARVPSSNRSPFLVRGNGDSALGDEDLSDYDFDSDASDFNDSLPVTGFAVASNRRQAEFHALFPNVDEGDYLIEDYGCALSKDILVHGRIYVSENHLCFHANIFGWVTNVVVPFADIRRIEKKMTALVIPNAICVTTNNAKYTFASFISRDPTYDVMMNIWRLCNPNAVMSATSFQAENSPGPSLEVKEEGVNPLNLEQTAADHPATKCDCASHYPETAMDASFPTTPEKTYNLMFNSGWLKEFMRDNQKLKDIESSDWQPKEENQHLIKTTSYIKPLNGSIGPKQTQCHITDELEKCDFDMSISVLTTTRTPDVPSGGVFSVKTRTCLTWSPKNTTRVLVTSAVEWTGKSWVKGIIEKSCMEGQRQYHKDLENGMRAHIKQHATEFLGKEQQAEDLDTASSPEDVTDSPTAAEAYAAKQRQRRDLDSWSMQGGIDSIMSGVKSIFSGIGDICSTLSDYLQDLPFTKSTLLVGIIFILLFSNVYTYVAYRPSRKNARRAQRIVSRYGDEDMTEALKVLLSPRGRQEAMDQARQLGEILDEVERRASDLRQVIVTHTEGMLGVI
ncbi:hypothetical protein BD324DRAFT_609913 [Kockovaella imperatae]|uniref:VASt domain-containing protein n=1 Tax=Kockovaella imperatae TaxID=4999 RepID=A0A1Y1U9P6_9TREE|nr:hypothetical protein BD324DRAFT_609913 [Kockovaella imperatae]ORX34749.1 hypothetical protein BD324DRAFT_609913 [Kockovaella imperatae]